MKTKNLLLGMSLLLAASVQADPLNYDYVYFSKHDIERDDTGRSDDSEVLGAFWEITDTLHLVASYDSSGAYASSFASPAEVKTYRFGIGGHFLLGEDFMLAPSVYAVRGDARLKDRSGTPPPGWDSEFRLADSGYAAGLDLRYRVTDWLELTAGGKRSSLFDRDTTETLGGILFHPTGWLAVGALYHDRDNASSTELTVRWYY